MNTQNVKTAAAESTETCIKSGSLYFCALTDAPDDAELMPGRVVSTRHQEYGLGVIEAVGEFGISVVFQHGGRLERVSRSALRGSMWQLYEQRTSSLMVERLAERADAIAALEKRDRVRQGAERSRACEALRRSADYAYLAPVKDGSAVQVAANVRAEIKHHFKKIWPRVKFSVRKGGSDSVSVYWTDGPTEKSVKAVVSKFRHASFDSMQDMYEYHESPFNIVFGGVKIVHVVRDYSDAHAEKAISLLKESREGFACMDVISAENFRTDKLYREGLEFFTWGFQGEIRRIMAETE